MATTITTTIFSAPPPPPPFSTLAAATTPTKLFHSSPFPRLTFLALHAKADRNSATEEDSGGIFGDDPFFFFRDDHLATNNESDDDDDDEESESSVELLMSFLQSMVKKISKRAKKASRSVLPPAIPTQLVSFAVDGIMLLASLSIVKALLQVVCTLGGTVFVSILLLRVIWATASYFQTSGSEFNRGGSSYGPAQPVT